jgi:hypothetical protein
VALARATGAATEEGGLTGATCAVTRRSPGNRQGGGARTVVTAGLVSLAFAGSHLGPMSSGTSRPAAAIAAAFAAAALLVGRSSRARDAGCRGSVREAALRLAPLALAAFAILLIPRAPVDWPLPLATLALLLLDLAAQRRGLAEEALPLRPVWAAGLVLCGFDLLTAHSPSAWVLVESVSRRGTAALGRLSGAGTNLGPSVAAIPLLVLVLAFLAARLVAARRERGAIALAFAWVVLLAAAGWSLGVPLLLRAYNAVYGATALRSVADMPVPSYPASVAVFLPLSLFVAWLAPVVLLAGGAYAPREARFAEVAPRAGDARPVLRHLLVASTGAVTAFLIAQPSLRLPGPEARPVVTLLDGGMVNWDVPSPSSQGLENAGMFGLLPRYLQAAGFDVRVRKDALAPASLASTRVVVVINPKAALSDDERAALQAHLRQGGGLVVLGDHTDILGIMEPLNGLLAPYGIAFRFDSAFTPGHWHNDAGFLPGPLTRRLDDANSRFQQSTGASLSVCCGAEPVALARWGFSDAGDRDNKDNAFLGDYIYQAREPLGDLPVVAMSRLGRGRVLVFGDTSAFQNIALPHSFEFVARVMQTAAGSERGAARALAPLGIVAFLAAAFVLAFRPRPRHEAAAAFLGGTLTGLALAGAAAATLEPPRPALGGRLAIVDTAHFNNASLDLWDARSLSGLNVNLARNGWLPVIDRDGDPRWLEAAQVFVTVAPRRPFSTAEVARLRAFAERGGDVVLAVGWEEAKGSRTLFDAFGLSIAPVPLGPVPVLRKIADPEVYRRLQIEPHFSSAWPVEGAAPPRDEILYASDAYPVVVRRPIGRGRLTIIGDGRFFLNKTLEEEGSSWQGNVAFLRRLFPRPSDPMVAQEAAR